MNAVRERSRSKMPVGTYRTWVILATYVASPICFSSAFSEASHLHPTEERTAIEKRWKSTTADGFTCSVNMPLLRVRPAWLCMFSGRLTC